MADAVIFEHKNQTSQQCSTILTHHGAARAPQCQSCQQHTEQTIMMLLLLYAAAAHASSNLQTTTRFQDVDAPLSVPGCWAYPDSEQHCFDCKATT